MNHITIIAGARPNFMKVAPIIHEIKKRKAEGVDIDYSLVHTGQHYDKKMSGDFFEQLNIPEPDANLSAGGGTQAEQTGAIMIRFEEHLRNNPTDLVLVVGDVTSTMACAITSQKLKIKVAHVEGGIRSNDWGMPEEINRIITDRVSDILFCSTENAIMNLKKEGFDNFHEKKIINTGDIMFDASIFYADRGIKKSKQLDGEFILCTFHRAENTDNDYNLLTILKAINEIGKKIKIIFPIHPRTKSKIEVININYKKEYLNIDFIDPLGYIDMISYIKNSIYVITDSGGLQKEAFFMKKMCLTLRNQTEWVELVESGYNYLCEIDFNKILEANSKILTISKSFQENFYGDGNTGNKIINELKKNLK